MKKSVIAALAMLLTPHLAHSACQTQRTIDLLDWYKSSGGYFAIIVTNTSEEDVTVKLKLYKSDGALYTESTESGTNLGYAGGFSGDPMSQAGSLLQPNKTGRLNIINRGSEQYGYAQLTWESEACLDGPLLVSGRYHSSNHYDWFRVNGGKGI